MIKLTFMCDLVYEQFNLSAELYLKIILRPVYLCSDRDDLQLE